MQKIEYIKTSDLKTHPNNPRLCKDHQFKILCESIKKNPDYFETRPILCNKDLVIFAGNMRQKAALEVGMAEVPVCIMDISEERQRELMIRDNRSAGEFSFDILANEFEIEDLKEYGFEDFELGMNEDEINSPIKKDLVSFKKSHILLSFNPDDLLRIQSMLEKIIESGLVEYEQSSN